MLKPFDKAAFYNLDGGKRSIRVKRTSDLGKSFSLSFSGSLSVFPCNLMFVKKL